MCAWTLSALLLSVLAYNFVEVAGCVKCALFNCLVEYYENLLFVHLTNIY